MPHTKLSIRDICNDKTCISNVKKSYKSIRKRRNSMNTLMNGDSITEDIQIAHKYLKSVLSH